MTLEWLFCVYREKMTALQMQKIDGTMGVVA